MLHVFFDREILCYIRMFCKEHRTNWIDWFPYQSAAILAYAAAASSRDDRGDISLAISGKAEEEHVESEGLVTEQYIPVDSERKRTTAIIRENGVSVVVSLGAAQVIEALCVFQGGEKVSFEHDIESLSAGQACYPLEVATRVQISPGAHNDYFQTRRCKRRFPPRQRRIGSVDVG